MATPADVSPKGEENAEFIQEIENFLDDPSSKKVKDKTSSQSNDTISTATKLLQMPKDIDDSNTQDNAEGTKATVLEASVEHMKTSHANNSIHKKEIRTAKEFMKNIQYKVPLKKLYKVLASCQYNEKGDFCPVLVEIKDPTILQNNNMCPFLLQVWTIKGELAFEQPLLKPVLNWNLSKNVFFMYICEEEPTEVCIVRLFMDRKPVIFKFMLPESIYDKRARPQGQNVTRSNGTNPLSGLLTHLKQNLANVVNDPIQAQSNPQRTLDVVDANETARAGEIEMSDHLLYKEQDDLDNYLLRKRGDLELMKSLGEIHMQVVQENQQDLRQQANQVNQTYKSVTQIFQNKIIQQTPAKNIELIGSFILVAFEDRLVYIDARRHNIRDNNVESDQVIKANIDEAEFDILDLNQNYKIVTLQDMGAPRVTSIVLENLKTRQIRFMRAELPEGNNEGEQKTLNFIQLGIHVNATLTKASPLIKYRSVAKLDYSTGKNYQISLVLRENGRFEVYSDFMLVNEYLNPMLQCVDIETDFDQFVFKFVKNSEQVTSQTKLKDLQFEIRNVRHYWRNRISFSTTTIKKHAEKWSWVTHKRIAKYFRLYTQILNFSIYMLVSHRNMISVYDIAKDQFSKDAVDEEEGQDSSGWIHTISFDAGNIRTMLIKKRPKEERNAIIMEKLAKLDKHDMEDKDSVVLSNFQNYQIVCFFDTHDLRHCFLDKRGGLTEIPYDEKRDLAPGRILKIKDDDKFNQGTLLLIDQARKVETYKTLPDMKNAKIFTFPLNSQNGGDVTLYCLKMQRFFPLLSSSDQGSPVGYDCCFEIMDSNRKIFEESANFDEDNSEDTAEEDTDEVKKYFKGQETMICVFINNRKKKNCKFYPIVKEREEQPANSKIIKNMRLLRNESNLRIGEFLQNEDKDDSQFLHTFFMHYEEFGEHTNCHITISENDIKIYDRKQKPHFVYEKLKIRGAYSVHQGYLYTISDTMKESFEMTKFKKNGAREKSTGPDGNFNTSGLFIFDVDAMFTGQIQKYKLLSTVGGQCNIIDNSKFANSFSIIQSFDNIIMIPFPHLNLMNCVGMGHKSEYMIWRSKNGFFTALDKRGILTTWSLLNGKMLYQEIQKGDAQQNNIKKYEVYKTDSKDITYMRDFYNFEDHTISLLKSKIPARDTLFQGQQGLKVVNSHFQRLKNLLFEKLKSGMVNREGIVPALESNLISSQNPNLKVNVINSMQQTDLFHFKVMQLRSHEDTQKASQCQLRFHFFFELLKKIDNVSLRNFDWDINSSPQQRLYLSKDTNRLMEVINNFSATVYYRKNLENDNLSEQILGYDEDYNQEKDQDHGQQVEWKIEFKISRFPTNITAQTSVPYLFSPNFDLQFDFNYSDQQFLIREARTQFVYYYFPSDLINTMWNENAGQISVKIIASRFKWETDKTFRIINKSNLDCLFEICTDNSLDNDINDRYLKLLSVVKIDNMHMNMKRLDSNHLLVDQCTLESRDVLERLIRRSQAYKTGLQHALNTNDTKFKLQHMITQVDFLQDIKGKNASFDVELSYTYLDWRIMDLIDYGKLEIEEVDEEQRLQLCFNILANGSSFLHLLAEARAEDQNDLIKAVRTSKGLFEIAKRHVDLLITGADDGCFFEIPVLPDIYGQTAMDICMGISENHHEIYKKDERDGEDDIAVENVAMAEVLFDGLKDYSFMQCSYFIADAINKATGLGLTSIKEYLDHRLCSAEHTFNQKTENAIYSSQTKYCPAMEDYGLMYTNIWVPESQIREKLFDPKKALSPMTLQYLDLPYIFGPTRKGFDFIYALSHCENMDIFTLKSVQIVIDCHARYWDKLNYLCVGLPMLINLLVFWYWSNIVLPNLDKQPELFDKPDQICRIFLVCTACYSFLLEITAIVKRLHLYLNDTARIFNICTPILILKNAFNTENRTEAYFWTIQTWAALAIWFRALLYLRTINTFSWLIRMITECFKDMLSFLLVFFIGVIAFADAFLSIETVLGITNVLEPVPFDENQTAYEKYVQGYVIAWQKSFLVALGEFDENLGFYREEDWLVFLLCCLFNIIVLLNLLIAIISETYTRIADLKTQNSYKEKAVQISMMQDMLLGQFKKTEDPNELVFIAKVINSEDIHEEDMTDKIDDLRTELHEVRDELKYLMKKMARGQRLNSLK